MHRQWIWLGLLCSAACCTGCGQRHYKVRPDAARETLTMVLDHWRSGETPESLRTATPEIVVQDVAWNGGAKLLEYEVLNEGEARDSNLVVKVKLTLRDKDDKDVKQEVTYLISTDPVRTMHRAMF